MGSACRITLNPSPFWWANAAPMGSQKSSWPSRLMTVNARMAGWCVEVAIAFSFVVSVMRSDCFADHRECFFDRSNAARSHFHCIQLTLALTDGGDDADVESAVRHR